MLKTDERVITLQSELDAILKDISLKESVLDFNWKFVSRPIREFIVAAHEYRIDSSESVRLETRTTGWFVHVEFERPDCDTGKIGIGRGRQEFIAVGTTESGVVKTAWLLVELMVRHELMEAFTYKGSRIFNPHHTVTELQAIRPTEKPAKSIIVKTMGDYLDEAHATTDLDKEFLFGVPDSISERQ